eukprot:2463667-Heterocapsa_arctica.AAC.1
MGWSASAEPLGRRVRRRVSENMQARLFRQELRALRRRLRIEASGDDDSSQENPPRPRMASGGGVRGPAPPPETPPDQAMVDAGPGKAAGDSGGGTGGSSVESADASVASVEALEDRRDDDAVPG